MNNFVNENSSYTGSKVRVKGFDFLKLCAIFLVIWGHTIQYFLSSNYYDEPIYRIIYSFHMPLFMMISGYFSLSSMSRTILDFAKKKFIQLLLPVFTWVVVLGLILFLSQTSFLTQSPTLWVMCLKETVVFILNGFVGPHPFWFLKTCFFCYLLAYCGSHLRLNKYLWMFLTLILSQRISHFALFDVMYPCFIIGMELRDNQKFYSFICRRYLLFLVFFLIMLCFWDQFFWGYDGFLKRILVNNLHIYNQFFLLLFSKLYRLAIGIVGSLAFLGMTCSLIHQEMTNRFISWCCNLGQYTLGIYILQSVILEIFMSKYILLDCINYFMFNFLIAPLLSFIFLIICTYIIRLVSRSSIIALLFWGNYNKS